MGTYSQTASVAAEMQDLSKVILQPLLTDEACELWSRDADRSKSVTGKRSLIPFVNSSFCYS